MNPDLWARLRAAYGDALDASATDRVRLLEELGRTDPDVHRELLKLLDADTSRSDFLDTPVARLAAFTLVPGFVLDNRFTLLRPLGKGGMGEVWAARDQKLRIDVAVKTIRADLIGNPSGMSRFMREIELARRVAHPNVCRVYEWFEHSMPPDSIAFLTMELIEGETLADRLAREQRLSFDDALHVARDVAAGLAAAHAADVIHRDLKPANIMLAVNSGRRRAVILDFGLARDPLRTHSGSTTTVGTLLGTPDYMAPEQITGAPVTPATDIYALGLVLYEMLDGRRPFAGLTTTDSWMRRAREGPTPLSGVVPGVRAHIDAALAKCLAYDPAHRHQSAAELLDALSDTRTLIVVPRSKRLWSAVAVVLIAALALGSVAAWRHFAPQLPSGEAMRWYDDAQQGLAEGASVRALNAITRAIDLAPWFAPAHAALAEVQLELDMPARAQEAMLRASALAREGPTIPVLYTQYVNGIQALLLHQCDQALQSLRDVAAVGDPMRPYRMVNAARAMERCDRPDEAMTLLREAAVIDPRNAAVPLRRARLTGGRREWAAAGDALGIAETLFRDRNNLEGVGDVLMMRGAFALERDQLGDAETTLESAERLAQSVGNIRQQIRVRLQQAVLQRKRGDVVTAERLTSEAIEQGRSHSLETLTLEGLFAAGNVHLVRNQFREAEDLYRRALSIAEAYRHEELTARAMLSLASVFVRTSQPDRALDAVEAALPFYRRVGNTRLITLAGTFVGQARMMREEYELAIAQFTGQRQQAATTGDTEQELQAREDLASAYVATARYAEALTEYEYAQAGYAKVGRARNVAFSRLNGADVLSRMGRDADARRLLKDAEKGTPDSPEISARREWVHASLDFRQGNYRSAFLRAQRRLERQDSSDRRVVGMLTIACVAAARIKASGASDYCARAGTRAASGKSPALRVESALATAEAFLVTGKRESAMEALRSADEAFLVDAPREQRWRYLALSAALDSSPAKVTSLLTRELDRLRLLWTDAAYAQWRTRADVSDVLALAQRAGVSTGASFIQH